MKSLDDLLVVKEALDDLLFAWIDENGTRETEPEMRRQYAPAFAALARIRVSLVRGEQDALEASTLADQVIAAEAKLTEAREALKKVQRMTPGLPVYRFNPRSLQRKEKP